MKKSKQSQTNRPILSNDEFWAAIDALKKIMNIDDICFKKRLDTVLSLHDKLPVSMALIIFNVTKYKYYKYYKNHKSKYIKCKCAICKPDQP